MRVIRKYANRRLYDTQQSRYVTLEDLRRLIIEEEPFRVEDAKSGEDLTRTILLSIIIEQEQADSEAEVFSNDLLAQLIRVYDMSSPLPLARYLEQGTQLMLEQQKKALFLMHHARKKKLLKKCDNWHLIITKPQMITGCI